MVYEHLSIGAENAKKGREICEILGIAQRDLTEAVARERIAGHPICASTGRPAGYYLAANRQEMETYCRSLRKRAGEIHRTRRACLQSLEKLPNGGNQNGERKNCQR